MYLDGYNGEKFFILFFFSAKESFKKVPQTIGTIKIETKKKSGENFHSKSIAYDHPTLKQIMNMNTCKKKN